MFNYYNENDPKAAAWLRELIKGGHISGGYVDERPIQDVLPDELDGFIQCHFFAGIGGWSYALRLAGWQDDKPVWTGSAPCQPFSVAGGGMAEADERHLWPFFRNLVAHRRPPVVFGEQVASKLGREWLTRVRADLEILGYGCGAADLCAASIGAPHIRQRLYWVAQSERDARESRRTSDQSREGTGEKPTGASGESGRSGVHGGLAFPDGGNSGAEGLQRGGQHGQQPQDDRSGGLADAGRAGNECRMRSSETPGAVSETEGEAQQWERSRIDIGSGSGAGGVVQPDGGGRAARESSSPSARHGSSAESAGGAGGVGIAASVRRDAGDDDGNASLRRKNQAGASGAWDDYELIPCADGKSRRIESGTFPLAHGIPGRVGLLRGYGNSICPQVAAEFIRACCESLTPLAAPK